MSQQRILETVRSFDGVLELAPAEGSEFPPIAWGDHFFYWSPSGEVPTNVQPYATIVTKDYPDDSKSDLDGDGRWRLNIHVGSAEFERLLGEPPSDFADRDFSAADVVLPHPVYGSLGWISVVNPDDTTPVVLDLLRAAHDDAKRRAQRRAGEA